MEYIRYEYIIRHPDGYNYIGSFTLKADADKSVVKELKAHKVERFKA